MKKMRFTALVLAVVMVLGVYNIYDNLFPKADYLSCPADVNWISVACDGISVLLEEEAAELVLRSIGQAVPTRIQSVNDRPSASEYYTIAAETDERVFYYYLYEESGEVYIEVPYEGIYEADTELLTFVYAQFQIQTE